MKIFISYAQVDEKDVRKLVEVLRRAHHEPWFDQQLVAGKLFDKQLLAAIQSCDCFLYALTPESVASRWCQWEFSQAVHAGKPILPVLMQSNAPLTGILKRIQHVDWSQGGDVSTAAELVACVDTAEPVSSDDVPLLPVPDDEPERPVEPEPLVRDWAGEAFDKAHELFLAGDYERALKLVTYCLKLEPEHHEAIVLFQQIEEGLGKPPTPPLVPVAEPKIMTPVPTVPRALRLEGILPRPFDWMHVGAGTVTLEDAHNRGGTRGGQTSIPGFWIAKYPITNAQFQVFVKKGYAEAQWWAYADKAKRWWTKHPKAAETGVEGNDLPRTNVCWYEALAFCAWLSEKAQLTVTLPTEQQWQRAAVGDEAWVYPWGEQFDSRLCNVSNGGPTPVTQYPDGASPFGVMDLIGNVWEWCLSDWKNGTQRAVRGGAYSSVPYVARAGYRLGHDPEFRHESIGFRVVLQP